MGTVEVFTKARMQAIEDSTVVAGEVNLDGDLILETRDGTPINAGHVKGADGSDATVPMATTSEAGKAFIASSAEVNAGTDPSKIVTPATLNSRTATETRTGLVELATSAEVIAGTDPSRVLTPITHLNYHLNEGRGTTAERNSKFGIPVSTADKVALANRQVSWYNRDTGWLESYFVVTGTSGLTVPGLIAGVADGWYPILGGPKAIVYPSAGQAFSSPANFTNWTAFTGNGRRNSTLMTLTSSNSRLTTGIAGRYRAYASMNFPNGTGTGVIGFQVVSKASGGTTVEMQQPIPLLSSFGQMDTREFSDIFIDATGYCLYRNVGGTWTIGSASQAFMGLEYLSPPLVSP